LKEIKMSRRFLFITVLFLLIVPLILSGWKKNKKKDKDTKKTKTEQVETTAEAPDPWLIDLRKPYMKYTGVILFHYTGPDGQKATWPKHSLVITESEAEKIKSGNYKIAVCWPTLENESTKSIQQGVRDASEHWGLEIIKETDAQNDPKKQISDIESVIAEKPDVIISAPVDVGATAAAYKKAAQAGIKLAFIMNRPKGLVYGQDYVGIIAPNNNDRALIAANMMAEFLSKDTRVALITWETDSWDITFTDELIKDTLKGRYPGIRILAHETFGTPEDAGRLVESVVKQFPDIKGIYTTNVYSALAVAEALKKASRNDIKVITTNLNGQALVNMTEGGTIIGTSADTTYYIGVDSVVLACYGLLGKEGPEFAVSPVMPVTKDTIRDAWELTKRIPLPERLEKALQEAGM